MALYPLQAVYPAGQFDLVDAYTVKGGEVGSLFEEVRANSATVKSAYDVKDGYTYALKRVSVAPWVDAAGSKRPLWLLDDGQVGYGTLFGTLIGQTVGLCTGQGTGKSCASALGPYTYSGSGKVTCWHIPGLYAISYDAVDTTASTGLVMSNSYAIPGAAVYPLQTGVLTLANGSGAVTAVKVGRFVEFETYPFLVTTPPSLVGATQSITRIILNYHVEN